MIKKEIFVSKLSSSKIDVLEASDLKIIFDESKTILLNIKDVNNLIISVVLNNDINGKIIYYSENVNDLNVSEHYLLNKGSYLNIVYGELADGNVYRDSVSDLMEYSEVLVEGAYLVNNIKKQTLKANHLGRNSKSDFNNYVVVNSHGDYYLDVIGKINKGMSGSKAFQTSKILTLDDNKNATVIPQLLIDENDVEASHAATIGQIDKETLYYMQSRGLTKMQALSLLMSSYLMPIVKSIEEKDLSEHIENLIVDKVNQICF